MLFADNIALFWILTRIPTLCVRRRQASIVETAVVLVGGQVSWLDAPMSLPQGAVVWCLVCR